VRVRPKNGMLQAIVNNVVVQILLGVGGMVFLITLGEALRNNAMRRGQQLGKEAEAKIKADLQKDIVAIRQEIDNLKSVLLEHSMSLDSNVETLKHRLQHLESQVHHREVENRG